MQAALYSQPNGVCRATAAAAPFTPAAISSIVEWWNIESLSATADGDPVGSWVGEVQSITPTAAGSLRPLYDADAGDGMPCIVPDGVDDVLNVALLVDGLTYFPNTSLEMWVVAYIPAAASVNSITLFQDSNADYIGSWLSFTDNNIYFDTPNFGVGRISVAEPGGYHDAWHVFRFAKHGNDRLIEMDGTSLATGTVAGNFASSAWCQFNICNSQTAMKIRHLLFFNAAVSGADLTNLRSYLSNWI